MVPVQSSVTAPLAFTMTVTELQKFYASRVWGKCFKLERNMGTFISLSTLVKPFVYSSKYLSCSCGGQSMDLGPRYTWARVLVPPFVR